MSSSLVTIVAESGEHASQGVGPIGYGIVAFCILMFMLLVTLAFRSVWTRRR